MIGAPAEAVVTDTGELWAEAPAESVAATVKLQVVEGVKPVTLKVVLDAVPKAVPVELPFGY